MKKSLLLIHSFFLFFTSNAQINLATDVSRASGDVSCCGFVQEQAFDDNVTTGPLITNLPASIGYNIETLTVINSYRWHHKTNTSNSYQPKSWEFQGSVDEKVWITLHTVQEYSAITGWSEYFTFQNSTAYRHYRIRINSVFSGYEASIGELQMFSGLFPILDAKLEAGLTGDFNSDNKVNQGEKITYTATITNNSVEEAKGVSLLLAAPSHTTLVAGGVKTSVLTRDDGFYTTPANTILYGTSVLENDFGLPSLSVISFGNVSDPSEVLVNGTNTASSNQGGTVRFSSDGTFTYTPRVGFSGYDQFAYTASSGTLPNDIGLVKVAVGSVVAAVNDHYNITGNIFNTQDASTGVLSNDLGGSAVVTEVEGSSSNVGVSVITAKGGIVKVEQDGSFSYYPPAGYQGNDHFAYTVNNLFNVPKTATVDFTISGMFWFIDNNSLENGSGTYSSPFNNLASFNSVNDGAPNNPSPGDNIFLYASEKEYDGGITLLDDQKLIGQGSTQSIETLTGITFFPGNTNLPSIRSGSPTITNGLGSCIYLAVNNTLSGLQIGNSPASAITGESFGMLTITEVGVKSTGQAIHLKNGYLNGNFKELSSFGGVHNVHLIDVKTSSISVLGVSSDVLSGANSDAFRIEGSNGSFTYSGSISNTSKLAVNITRKDGGVINISGKINPISPGTGISVSGNSNGTLVNFNGEEQNINSATATGINLQDNVGSVINFTGGKISITTTTGSGFVATEGGIISVNGQHNKIISAGGTALNISNSVIGSSGIIFQSITANGGSNGIILNNTGSLAGLTVTGDGTTWASGGTIQNTRGQDGELSGNGIYLNNTHKVSLSYMKLNGHQNNALFGSSVNDLTMHKLRFTGNNGSSSSALYEESAIHLVDLSGVVSLKNSYVSGGAYDNVLVRNTSSASPILTSLLFDTDTIETLQGSTSDLRHSALRVIIGSGTANTQIINSQFTYWWKYAINLNYQNQGSGNAVISHNDVVNSSGVQTGSGGIWVAGGDLIYTISNNNVQNTTSTAISASKDSFGKYMRGTISDNTIGTSGITGSGSVTGYGIYANHSGLNTTSVNINNNIIKQVNKEGIKVQAGENLKGGGRGIMNVIIKGNDITETGGLYTNVINVLCGLDVGDMDEMCLDISQNLGRVRGNNINVAQSQLATIKLVGYKGDKTNNSHVTTYLFARNPAAVKVSANNSGKGGCFINTPNGVPCLQ